MEGRNNSPSKDLEQFISYLRKEAVTTGKKMCFPITLGGKLILDSSCPPSSAAECKEVDRGKDLVSEGEMQGRGSQGARGEQRRHLPSVSCCVPQAIP